MIGEEVIGHRDDGTELMPFQKPSHHGSEAGGNIPRLFRLRWCNGLAAALGIGLAPFCNSRRTGKGCRQVCRMAVFVTLHRSLLRSVNDTLASVLEIFPAGGHQGSPDLDRDCCW